MQAGSFSEWLPLFVLRYVGAESKPSTAVKALTALSAPDSEAEQFMDNGDLNTAERLLKEALEVDPGRADALDVLRQVYWRQNDVLTAFQETTIVLCGTHVKSHDMDAAWRLFEDYLNSGAQIRRPRCGWNFAGWAKNSRWRSGQ